MAQRDAFLLRIDPAVLAALRRWADDDLRSLNGQIEFLLRRALADGGRWRSDEESTPRAPRPPRKRDGAG
ncbi:MAG: hypothetical protein KGQ61_02250 [Planctomycetes bacterium]|nr:hypothetical protein [Planctomycetota bacterium]